MKKIIILGATQFSELMHHYISNDTDEKIECFMVDKKYLSAECFCGLPIVAYEELDKFPTHSYKTVLTFGYKNMNVLREKRFEELKVKGYDIYSYCSSKALIGSTLIGEGNHFLEGTVIQPFVKIGDNNIFFNNCSISHHSQIGDNNYFAPRVSLSGNVKIANNCFLGNNCTIKNGLSIGNRSLIGASAYLSENAVEESVYVPTRSVRLNKTSSQVILT